MLSDTKLRNLKPRERPYKVADRDGLYVVVTPSGTISFRYNYRLNGRQETLVIGRYGTDGITLAEARERLLAAKKLVSEGKSPARQKSRETLIYSSTPDPKASSTCNNGCIDGLRKYGGASEFFGT